MLLTNRRVFSGAGSVTNNKDDEVTSGLFYEKSLVSGKVGALHPRSSNTAGTITMSSGHGIITGKVGLFWEDSYRYNVDAVVTTNSIAISGGTGDNLPVDNSQILVCQKVNDPLTFKYDVEDSIGVQWKMNSTPSNPVSDGTCVVVFNDIGETETGILIFTNGQIRAQGLTGGSMGYDLTDLQNLYDNGSINSTIDIYAGGDAASTFKLLLGHQ